MAQLRSVGPDMGDHLQDVPDDWTAAELSMVLFSRPDWALLSGMFGCLWHEVETTWSSQEDRAAIEKACTSALAKWVRAYIKSHDHTPCPHTAVQGYLESRSG